MEVRPISSYQPQFNGYVDKSVRKYVNKAVKNECKHIVKMAEKNNVENVDDKLFDIHALGSKILNSLSAFMQHTHKDTKFTMGNTHFASYPRFKNPISQHIVRIYSPLTDKAPYMDICGEIAMPKTPVLNPIKEARITDLYTLEKYAENLKKIEPKEVDLAFYKAEKEYLEETKDDKLGLIAEMTRTFHEASVENFYEKINEKIN